MDIALDLSSWFPASCTQGDVVILISLHQTSGVLVSKTLLHVGGHVLCCSAILYVLLLCAE